MPLPDVPAAKIANHSPADLTGLSAEFLQGKLNEVVDQITVRWGSLVEARLASGKLPQRLYEAVVVRVAARVFENVEGYKSEQEGQYQYERSAAVASGHLWFTEDDERDLTGTVTSRKSHGPIGTVQTPRNRPGFA